ncbi:cobyrinate a,c-diamide synthase [Blastochloris tepida]|uniref:Hydrogenobyrinate a,c-diamide synthase n=1 Tax=Blastochloris tepida TaxID=2233851 RepID=A0A348G4A4_9HYPH|nr:cobyrinate a,c-diamide synthase [Blastochloris tepida]BBF94387.1 Cobyrinate a,c-diamide synthase [Blastochloris tepida]
MVSRLFISATHKSSGKTTLTLGLAAALEARGLAVQTFKKGPDYIDPLWHACASGRPCYNLDFNTQSEAEIVATFRRNARGADIAIVEGNKGLHDGLDLEGRDCSAALAKLVAAPVVLVVDATGITRGAAPLVAGYAAFDPKVTIAGVILNKVGSARQETKLRQVLERYTSVPVLGAVRRNDALAVAERHLGLTTPLETESAAAVIAAARDLVADCVDLDRLIGIAATATLARPAAPGIVEPSRHRDVRIAVARDAAFGFYYADDLDALAQAGADCVFFDTLADSRLPAADALLIGGGFPETQAARLAANTALLADIRQAISRGLPVYAECGGLMYLTRGITWRGITHAMVGAIPADTVMHERPQGHGLVTLEETAVSPWPGRLIGATIPAHEFHHAALENIAPDSRFAYRVRRGVGIGGGHDGVVVNNVLASFSHLRSTSRNAWAQRFVAFIREQRTRRSLSGPQDVWLAANG